MKPLSEIDRTRLGRFNVRQVQRHKKIPCIRCRVEFRSEGTHHRMCNVCRHHNDYSARYGSVIL